MLRVRKSTARCAKPEVYKVLKECYERKVVFLVGKSSKEYRRVRTSMVNLPELKVLKKRYERKVVLRVRKSTVVEYGKR